MSNLIQFPGNRTEQPEAMAEPAWKRRERLASRDQAAVQRDIDRHVAARRVYGQALVKVSKRTETCRWHRSRTLT